MFTPEVWDEASGPAAYVNHPGGWTEIRDSIDDALEPLLNGKNEQCQIKSNTLTRMSREVQRGHMRITCVPQALLLPPPVVSPLEAAA